MIVSCHEPRHVLLKAYSYYMSYIADEFTREMKIRKQDGQELNHMFQAEQIYYMYN